MISTWFHLLLLWLPLAVVLALPGRSFAEAPNVLVVLVDALRADRLTAYGYGRPTTPQLDRLAKESLLFVDTSAQSPWTKPSIPTLFTSLYPIQHGVYEGEAHSHGGDLQSDVLADEYTTMAEIFSGAGYATAAFVNNAHLEARHGFSQGFDVYQHGDMDAPEINRRFAAYVDEERSGPFFAYLHYLDVHWPFQPGEPFRSRFAAHPSELFDRASWGGLRDGINEGTLPLSKADRESLLGLHDGGLAELDHYVGEMVETLRKRGLLEQTVLLLTSDHGEELLDHGRVGHGGTLYREVIEVPLMIRLPDRAIRGRVQQPARLIDVLPTLLDAVGIDVPAGIEGRSLLEDAKGEVEVIAETRHKRTYRVSVRRGDWKYIRTYKASGRKTGGKPREEAASRIGLSPGMRIKVKGFFDANGVLRAAKVTRKDVSDDDLEISGPIAFVRLEDEVFGIHGFELAGSRLIAPDGTSGVGRLTAGTWVKAEGKLTGPKTIEADDVELLAEQDRQTEVEGIVESVEAIGDDSLKAVVGGAAIFIDRSTRRKGLARGAAPAAAAPDQEDAFTPERLLVWQGGASDEQLFDLERDPAEQADLLAENPPQLNELRDILARWLQRMSRHQGPRAERQTLDASTIEELRTLGYLE